MKDDQIQFNRFGLILSILVVFTIWFVYWCEIQFGKNFNDFGVYPRYFYGLRGVFFAPFIHSNTTHLFNNSIPFLVLLNLVFSFYKESALKTLVYGTLLTGLMTWLMARNAYHIGLSGVIYMLFSFVFFGGIIKRHYRLIASSLIVIFLYGSMIWYVFPIKEGISWEGHLSGFLAGLLLAFIYRKKGLQQRRRVFRETSFDRLFDEKGNFIGDQDQERVTKNSADELPHKE